MSSRLPIALATLAWTLALVAPARADVAAILRSEGSDARLGDRAEQIVADLLSAEGVEVIRSDDASERLARSNAACGELGCAVGARHRLEADVVLLVAAAPSRVEITMIGGEGRVCAGSRAIEARGVDAAALEAFRAAQRRQRAGRGPWIAIEGEPQGALVVVDGTEVGVTPYFGAIEPGRHRVDVRLDGFSPEERELEIGLDDQREHLVRVALTAEQSDRPPGPPRTEASGWNYVIGAALLGASIASAIGPVRTLLADDTCRPDAQGQCEVPALGPVSVALSIASGASLIGAAIFVLGTPIEAQVEAGTDRGALRLRARF